LNRRVSFDQFQTIESTIEFHSMWQLDVSQLCRTALFLIGMICAKRGWGGRARNSGGAKTRQTAAGLAASGRPTVES
jgi:hypothetical protein